jgi:hypothetical protein
MPMNAYLDCLLSALYERPLAPEHVSDLRASGPPRHGHRAAQAGRIAMNANPEVSLLLGRLSGVKQNGAGWTALCPNHDDKTSSLSVSNKRGGGALVHCFAGCSYGAILTAVQLEAKGVSGGVHHAANGATLQPTPGLTLVQLAEAKKLPVDFLKKFGLSDAKLRGTVAVRIPYLNGCGDVAGYRYRTALEGPNRFKWRQGDHAMLYALDRLAEIRRRGWTLVVEGESDTWTGWFHDNPVIGAPGKTNWRDEWGRDLDGVALVVWQEPGASDFPERIGKSRPDLTVIESPPYKDLSEAHLKGENVPALVERLRAAARPWVTIAAERLDARRSELRAKAQAVLDHPDPLELVKQAILQQSYGGDLDPPMLVYLAISSRVLALRRGSMPVHLLLLGESSAGKSYTVRVVIGLLPPEAHHTIDAATPRALIYDAEPLKHRALILGEADSLPASEDSNAASALRSFLQDGRLRYLATVRNPETGAFETKWVEKDGPTVLITTATKKLGEQMDTRLFSLEVPEDPEQVREALKAQARLAHSPPRDPDPSLAAFQSYLQACAPWDVDVPYVDRLADLIGRTVAVPRVLRDFTRLVAFIKTVAVIRHRQRARDADGRVIANLDDYATIRGLVGDMYSGSVTGASEGVRKVVQAVSELGAGCNLQQACNRLGPATNKGSVSRWVRTAIRNGWLINREVHKRNRYDLETGEPIPASTALPEPEALEFQGCRVAVDTAGRDTPCAETTPGPGKTTYEF